MLESTHRFYCPACQIYITSVSTDQLCICLNDHNRKHPGSCVTWTPVAIVHSANYEEPNDPIASWTEFSPEERDDIRASIKEAVHEAIAEEKETVPVGYRKIAVFRKTTPSGQLTDYDKNLLSGMKIKW